MNTIRKYLDILTEAEMSEMKHPTMPLPDRSGIEVGYMNTNPRGDDDEEARVELRPDGSYYGACDKYDFSAPTADAMRAKLTRFGFTKYQFSRTIRRY